ncbi:MAG: ComF family protein [Acidobacteriota bacterium]|nr:ComF family protein [Acidobacteriota bacterium]
MSLWGRLNRTFYPVKIIIFPSYCQLCGQLLKHEAERVICSDCLKKLEIKQSPSCPVCGRFYFNNLPGDYLCGECLGNPPPFDWHRSLGLYDGRLKEIILIFKYQGYEVLSRPLGRLAYEKLSADQGLSGVDFIVPVPLHKEREKKRGFNQSELLSREISKLSSIPVMKSNLIKTKPTPAQVSLEAAERKSNLRGVFKVKRPEKIAGRTLLLIDDVFTTGSTIKECTKELKKAGAREVRVITLARAQK